MRTALFIGLNKYQEGSSGLDDLQGAMADAYGLYRRFFQARGDWESVYLFPSRKVQSPDGTPESPDDRLVTAQELKSKIREVIKPQTGEHPNTILIYFSGHAVPKHDESDREFSELYLSTADEEHAYSVNDLLRMLERSQAEELLVWLDCCHGGVISGQQLSDGKRWSFLAAAGSNQGAYEAETHGLFTKQLLASLDELSGLPIVNSRLLEEHLKSSLRGYPQYLQLRNKGDPIVLLHGGTTFKHRSDVESFEVYESYLRRLRTDWDNRYTFAGSRPDTSVFTLPISQVFIALPLSANAVPPSGSMAGWLELHETNALEVLARPQHRLAILKGELGSGKTTLTAYIAMCIAGARRDGRGTGYAALDQCWPIRVKLRAAAEVIAAEGRSPEAIWSLIGRTLSPGTESHLAAFPDRLRRCLQDRGLFLFDGLDEVASSQRPILIDALGGFAADLGPNARVLLTTRPYALPDTDRKMHLEHFQVLGIRALGPGDIEGHIERWYEAIQRREGWDDQQRRGIAEELKVRLRNSPDLRRLAEKPLLLNLMLTLHGTRIKLPDDRAGVIERAVSLLLERWDRPADEEENGVEYRELAKQIRANAPAIRHRLEQLAYILHERLGKGGGATRQGIAETDGAGLAEREVVSIFGVGRPPGVDPSNLFEYLNLRTGLLVPTRAGQYEFPARSFCEYLAACHLVERETAGRLGETPPGPGLIRLVHEDPAWWREVFLLAVGRRAEGGQHINDALELVLKLIPLPPNRVSQPTDEQYRDAILAARALLELRIPERGLENAFYPDLRDRIRDWLVRLIQADKLPPAERAEAGDHLGQLGDPRRGVGCQDGLPDVDWQQLAGGDLRLGAGPNSDFIRLDAFAIARFPATVAQYQCFIQAGGYQQDDWWKSEDSRQWRKRKRKRSTPLLPTDWDEQRRYPNRAVVGISWYEAKAYCDWLAQQLGGAIRLPTEWEWQYAVRGETERRFPWGNDPDSLAERANTAAGTIGHPTAVGIYPQGKSSEDVYDLAGNCCEWCCNLFEEMPDVNDHHDCGVDEHGGGIHGQEPERAIRGGSWWQRPEEGDASRRQGARPYHSDSHFGLRPVREQPGGD